MVQPERVERQQRFRGTIRTLFQRVRDSEDRNPRDGHGQSKRVYEDVTQGIREVRRLARMSAHRITINYQVTLLL